jgi:hypothetical protein
MPLSSQRFTHTLRQSRKKSVALLALNHNWIPHFSHRRGYLGPHLGFEASRLLFNPGRGLVNRRFPTLGRGSRAGRREFRLLFTIMSSMALPQNRESYAIHFPLYTPQPTHYRET